MPGNAKIEGMDTDLNLTGAQYNIAVSIFFIPYVLFGMFAVPLKQYMHECT